MRRRVTIRVPAVARITGFVDYPDLDFPEELSDDDRSEIAYDATVSAGVREADALRSKFGEKPIMTGVWPELLGGASIEIVLDNDGVDDQVDVHTLG